MSVSQNKKIRIGCGQGFWGDWLEGPRRLVESGNLNYLILDYLAEVTMSILAKQKAKNPAFGFGADFPELLASFSDKIVAGQLKVITNAGGLNPLACAEKCLEKFRAVYPEEKLPKIAIVTGDDLLPQLDSLIGEGQLLAHMESHDPISHVRGDIKSINAYIGADSVVEALNHGAQIVLTGRIADPSMCLAPLVSEFSWSLSDWDRLASGIVAGHIIECGAQSTGGNFSYDWQNVSEPWNIGYPIVECVDDGSFVVMKPENSGGVVSIQSVTEQLVYEIGDPQNYITPDVIVDFTSLQINEQGANRVHVSGVKGKPKPERFKVSATYSSGYKAEGNLVLVGPEVLKKAGICRQMIEQRLKAAGLVFDEILFENLGSFSCIPGMAEKQLYPEPGEVVFRVAVRDREREKVARFTREVAPLVLSGPSGITGYAGGKGEVKEVFSFWPSLVNRANVRTSWRFVS